MVEWKHIEEGMTDAGCSVTAIHRAERFFQCGQAEDLLRCLRSCRCDVLEEIHEKQKKLDRLDLLILDAKNM